MSTFIPPVYDWGNYLPSASTWMDGIKTAYDVYKGAKLGYGAGAWLGKRWNEGKRMFGEKKGRKRPYYSNRRYRRPYMRPLQIGWTPELKSHSEEYGEIELENSWVSGYICLLSSAYGREGNRVFLKSLMLSGYMKAGSDDPTFARRARLIIGVAGGKPANIADVLGGYYEGETWEQPLDIGYNVLCPFRYRILFDRTFTFDENDIVIKDFKKKMDLGIVQSYTNTATSSHIAGEIFFLVVAEGGITEIPKVKWVANLQFHEL